MTSGRWRVGQREEADRGRRLRRQGLRSACRGGHRRYGRRSVQGHGGAGDQPDDQGREHRRAADRALHHLGSAGSTLRKTRERSSDGGRWPLPCAAAARRQARRREDRLDRRSRSRSRTPTRPRRRDVRRDGGTYTVRGHLTAPKKGKRSGVTLYLHGLGLGEWLWNFQPVKSYNFVAGMARAGHASVSVDRLGYGASDKPPDGKSLCIGSQADVAHQIVGQLKAGSYTVAGRQGAEVQAGRPRRPLRRRPDLDHRGIYLPGPEGARGRRLLVLQPAAWQRRIRVPAHRLRQGRGSDRDRASDPATTPSSAARTPASAARCSTARPRRSRTRR